MDVVILVFSEAQLFYNYIYVTGSLTTSHLALSTTSPLFVDQLGRSFRVCQLEFDKEAISDG